MQGPRRLLARLRELTARRAAPDALNEVTRLVASDLVAEVCTIYVMRAGEMLEIVATEGLDPRAVGRTRLRVGEGIVGTAAAQGASLNLPDAQNHPAFVYRPETGEEPFASLLAVPVRRAGACLGVITVQNRAPRRYADDEVEGLETVAMWLAEVLAASGAAEAAAITLSATLPARFEAVALAPGLAIGPALRLGAPPAVLRVMADDPAAELHRLDEAIEIMQRSLEELVAARLPDQGAPREVLDAYRLIATDGGWLGRARDAVRGGLTAEAAVDRVLGDLRARIRQVKDPYLRERLADLEDLANRLLGLLVGVALPTDIPPGALLLARRIGPAELLDWHARGIAGLVIEEGTPTAHATIIARALGLPTLGGARGAMESAADGDEAILDADEGRLILRPEGDVRHAYAATLVLRSARAASHAAFRDRPAVTADGARIQVLINAGLAMDLPALDATGADGIGLFRTEITVLARGRLQEAAEQVELYARVLAAARGRPVVFRTLDLGGDKLLPGVSLEAEENPALGWRSLRIGLDRPALLRRQLRALLLAAGRQGLTVMFPMVTTVEEFRAARALLRAEAARLGVPADRLTVGAMLEVPALLFQLDALLAEADFVSIGSNDLTQFLYAADRGSARLAGRYDFLSAPVLAALERVVAAGQAAGKPISLCGEAAARPLEALALVGIGLWRISMPASSVLPVKAMLAAVDLAAFRPVLAGLRRAHAGDPSLRDPLAAWARDRGIPV